jgi:hypothetical protein
MYHYLIVVQGGLIVAFVLLDWVFKFSQTARFRLIPVSTIRRVSAAQMLCQMLDPALKCPCELFVWSVFVAGVC